MLVRGSRTGGRTVVQVGCTCGCQGVWVHAARTWGLEMCTSTEVQAGVGGGGARRCAGFCRTCVRMQAGVRCAGADAGVPERTGGCVEVQGGWVCKGWGAEGCQGAA